LKTEIETEEEEVAGANFFGVVIAGNVFYDLKVVMNGEVETIGDVIVMDESTDDMLVLTPRDKPHKHNKVLLFPRESIRYLTFRRQK